MLAAPLLAGLRHRDAGPRRAAGVRVPFHRTTSISWLELGDLNHPLMKRLSIEAPGTYHHSLVVASLAEAAAESIGANASMCRVCSYFHDIGKLTKPEYFIENMDPRGQSARRPHAPRMSALVHDRACEGRRGPRDQARASTRRSPTSSSSIMATRWSGSSTAARSTRRRKRCGSWRQDKAREDDVPEVTEDGFRYPGPAPPVQGKRRSFPWPMPWKARAAP